MKRGSGATASVWMGTAGVPSRAALANDIAAKKPGDTTSIGLLRPNGKGHYEKKTVSVTLGSRPNSVPNANTPEG